MSVSNLIHVEFILQCLDLQQYFLTFVQNIITNTNCL